MLTTFIQGEQDTSSSDGLSLLFCFKQSKYAVFINRTDQLTFVNGFFENKVPVALSYVFSVEGNPWII